MCWTEIWLGRNTETEKMLKCQHFPINTIASYMDPKISISVNIAKWHLGCTRGGIGGLCTLRFWAKLNILALH